MGETFDATNSYFVNDLLELNLGQFASIINRTYSAAMAEYLLEQRLKKICKLWEGLEFKVSSWYNIALQPGRLFGSVFLE